MQAPRSPVQASSSPRRLRTTPLRAPGSGAGARAKGGLGRIPVPLTTEERQRREAEVRVASFALCVALRLRCVALRVGLRLCLPTQRHSTTPHPACRAALPLAPPHPCSPRPAPTAGRWNSCSACATRGRGWRSSSARSARPGRRTCGRARTRSAGCASGTEPWESSALSICILHTRPANCALWARRCDSRTKEDGRWFNCFVLKNRT